MYLAWIYQYMGCFGEPYCKNLVLKYTSLYLNLLCIYFVTLEKLICIGINYLWHMHIPTVPDQITVLMCFADSYHCSNNSANPDIFLNHHFLIGYSYLTWHPAVCMHANYWSSDMAPLYLSDMMEYLLSHVSFQSTRWLFHHSWNLWTFLKVNNILHPWKWREYGNDQWFTVWDF